MPCRAAKGLECVFPIWFTQCGRVWFTLAMPCPCRAPTMPFFSRPRHSTTVLCCGFEKKSMIGTWHGHGMASVNQTRPHCVNQMGTIHSKPLAARHGRGRHGRGMGTACYVWIGLNTANKASSSVVPYCIYITRKFCQIIPRKKLLIFSYVTELVVLSSYVKT